MKQKRGDLIADRIKDWIVARDMKVGDKLPVETELVSIFKIGKSSAREALKSLEVQGLIRTTAGQGGGSFLIEVPEEHVLDLVQNYFYFKKVTPEQVYEVRRHLEPILVASVATTASDDLIEALEENVARCTPEPKNQKQLHAHLAAHNEFHEMLAKAAHNPVMCFQCRLINHLVRQVMFTRTSTAHKELLHHNWLAHGQLVKALRAHDGDTAAAVMHDHIRTVESYFAAMNPTIEPRLGGVGPVSEISQNLGHFVLGS